MARGQLSILAAVGAVCAVTLTAATLEAAAPALAVQAVPGVTCPAGGFGFSPPAAPGVRWSGCDLAFSNMASADLARSFLRDSDLEGVDLKGANLSQADLTGADLSGAYLSGTNLSGVNLTDVDLTGVQSEGGSTGAPAALPPDWILVGGYLVGPGVDLVGTDLGGVNLAAADLTGVQSGNITGVPAALPSGWSLQNGYLIGPGANLLGANLAGTNLSGVDLSGANLNSVQSGAITGTPSELPANWSLVSGYLVGPRANLDNADLSGANLSGADLVDASLDGANLSDANLSNADLTVAVNDTEYSGDNLQAANLSGADLSGANLAGVDLAGANVSTANLGTANVAGLISGSVKGTPSSLPANWSLTGGYLIGPDANLIGADLSGLNLSGVDLDGVRSGSNSALATALPADWSQRGGYLLGPTADLVFQNLATIDLSGIDLSGADLTGVTSSGITGAPAALPAGWIIVKGFLIGPGARLFGNPTHVIDLSGADLSKANLAGISAEGITGTPPSLPSGYSLIGGYIIGPGISLQRLNANDLDLAGANLSGANLAGAVLRSDNLTGADLSGANITGADLTVDNLSGANLSGATLSGVHSSSDTGSPTLPASWQLSDGYLIGPAANLSGANLTGLNLSGASLANVDLSFATLASSNFSGAGLNGANFSDADLTGASLKGASITGTTFGQAIWSSTTCPDGTNSNSYVDGCFSSTSTATPAASPQVTSGTAGKDGWYTSPVTVTWNWSDARQLNFTLCPESSTTTGNGTTPLTAACTDLAGNTLPESYPVKVDATGLSVKISGVRNDAVYVLGSAPQPSCVTTDTVSGVATPAKLTVKEAGSHGTGLFTATCSGAVSVAGGTTASVAVSYRITEATRGFSTPRAGSQIRKSAGKFSVRFQLVTANGRSISGALGRALSGAHAVRVALSGPGIKPQLSTCAWSNTAFNCTLRIPSGVRKGTRNRYSVTAEVNPGGGFIVAPGIRGGVNPETISFR